MKELNLQLFAGELTVTVYKGENITTATASPDSELEEGDKVELTIVAASGYRPVIQVISGGVTIDEEELTFEMGATDVVINVTAESDTLYRVTEECVANINGKRTALHRNVHLRYSANGAVAEATTEGTSITDAGTLEALLAAKLIEKI